MVSKHFIPVKYGSKYELSGNFKSVGEIKSRIYFGITVFDKNKKEIYAINANPLPNAKLTELVHPAQKGDKSIFVKNIDGWEINKDYAVAFGAVADFSDLPNRNIISGIINIIKKNNEYEVQLSVPLNRGYPTGTGVREHYGAFGTHIYCVARNCEIPDKWKTYSGKITGANNGNASHQLFRPGTSFIKIILLPNFRQKYSNVKLAVNNIEFKEVK